MPTFISPAGNFEVWEEKPDGYCTEDEWRAAQPHSPDVPIDPNAEILLKIQELENRVTRRRTREALLSDAGRAWLEDIDAQIAQLRTQLV